MHVAEIKVKLVWSIPETYLKDPLLWRYVWCNVTFLVAIWEYAQAKKNGPIVRHKIDTKLFRFCASFSYMIFFILFQQVDSMCVRTRICAFMPMLNHKSRWKTSENAYLSSCFLSLFTFALDRMASRQWEITE